MRFEVHPSVSLLLISLLAHLGALFAILVSELYPPNIESLLIVLLVFSMLRRSGGRILQLRIRGNHWLINDEPQQLVPPLFTGRWFLVLRFSKPGYVIIGRDSLAEEEYRRLTVLLRSKASRMMEV